MLFEIASLVMAAFYGMMSKALSLWWPQVLLLLLLLLRRRRRRRQRRLFQQEGQTHSCIINNTQLTRP
jgi:hypothetical protein